MSLYIAIDGSDGCGKSTQASRLAGYLRAGGRSCVHLREPGSTPLGEGLRKVLLDPESGDLEPLAEALAFSAARREMLVREVVPALVRGEDVVTERCFLSTVAYQCRAPGRARAADEEFVRRMTEGVIAIARPDLVVLLDVPETVAAQRLAASGRLDRIESHPAAFHARVRAAMRDFARPDSPWSALLRRADDGAEVSRIVSVDGTDKADGVHEAIVRSLSRFAR